MKSETGMIKLLVRRAGSNKFLSAAGHWTRQAEKACRFPHLLHAIHFCLAKGLKTVEVVFRLEGESADRSYPLHLEEMEPSRHSAFSSLALLRWREG